MAWFGTILLATGAALGRLVSVHLLPTSIVTFAIFVTLRVSAFTGDVPLQWSDMFRDFRVDTAGVVLFVGGVFVLTVILQPFEIAAVRLLEGYWGEGILGQRAARVAGCWHRHRKSSADRDIECDEIQREEPAKSEKYDVESQAKALSDAAQIRRRAGRARRRLRRYPPSVEDVMPTLLGNILRTAERRAGERYYLPTEDSLTRLYQQLSDRLSAAYNASVDAVDAAAMMAIATAVSAILTLAAFFDDGFDLLTIPAVLFVVSFLSYRGALVAAAQYGFYMDLAYDMHRFDLYKSLHLDLPRDAMEERELATLLDQFWSVDNAEAAQDIWKDTVYWHYDVALRPQSQSEAGDG